MSFPPHSDANWQMTSARAHERRTPESTGDERLHERRTLSPIASRLSPNEHGQAQATEDDCKRVRTTTSECEARREGEVEWMGGCVWAGSGTNGLTRVRAGSNSRCDMGHVGKHNEHEGDEWRRRPTNHFDRKRKRRLTRTRDTPNPRTHAHAHERERRRANESSPYEHK
jgi:hypothetical protein